MRRALIFSTSLALAFCAGAAGSFFTTGSVDTWYLTLAKPALNPPSWVFAPVWTTLYAMMAVAAALVYEQRARNPRLSVKALAIYGAHLILNALWSVAFFGLHNPALALGIIALLWVCIALLIALFSRVSRTAGVLLAPYLAWVSFASYLNLMIVLLNP